jgi:5-formyltetrahydrofolate cyclo-ligase
MPHDPKITLRRQLLAQRRSLPIPTWQQQSQKICDHLAESDLIKNAEMILGFISFRQEPDLMSLYQQFPQKTWGFPRCVDQNLDWHQINPANFLESTQIGNFGILEPIPTLPTIDLLSVDVILVPAIACDHQGYRLGYGGGFYDRFLLHQTGFTISVVFADFYFETLPQSEWDIPTKAVCSENGIIS